MLKFLSLILLFIICLNKSEAKKPLLDLLTKPINAKKDFVTWSIGSPFKPVNKSVDFEITITSSTEPGTYRVLFFFTGLDGIAPSFAYSGFYHSIITQTNLIIVSFDKLGEVHLPDVEEEMFEKTLNWTINNLPALFDSKKTPEIIRGLVKPDLVTNGVTLMSHSSAGHVVASYLNKTCGIIKTLILLDPVDGFDPFGFIKIFITNPPAKLPFQIPTLIAASGYSQDSVKSGFPPCAPTNYSNVRFYDSLAGPTWFLNYTTYGHADILDPFIRKYSADLICKTCPVDCDFDSYDLNLARGIHYFLDGVNNRNQTLLNAIQNPKNSTMFDPTMSIDSFYELNGFDVTKTGAFCNHL